LLAIFALWGLGWGKFGGKMGVLRIKVKPRVKPKLAMTAGINILCYKSKTLSNGEHPLMEQSHILLFLIINTHN